MFRYIKGTIEMKLRESIVLECGGVGFEIFIPLNSRLFLLKEGTPATVFTHMNVKEDGISLYGFDDEEGLMLFEKLITVSGVGAKVAMAVLSAMPAAEARNAIAFEDPDMLTRANGVGKKVAQRIVLELKDKIERPEGGAAPGAGSAAAPVSGTVKEEATDALVALGYSRKEAAAALEGTGDDLSVEEYIKAALKNI